MNLPQRKVKQSEFQLSSELIDTSESDDTTPIVRFEITSFGADYDVAGFVARLQRGDIIIPPFQRGYVWHLPEASRFIESILLGLPVPGVFLAKDSDTNKLLVIDGQQRLRTLQYFIEGVFNPKNGEKSQKVFELTKVAKQFVGFSYRELSDSDRRKINDYVIHATIVKQDKPSNDDTSIYHIFERLNTTGQRLSPQEIRVAVYRGLLLDLIEELNENYEWRQLFGKINPRLKDRELILRFLAFNADAKSYERPLGEFLSKFASKNRNPKPKELEAFRNSFCSTIKIIFDSLGTEAFRPARALNVAVFDSVMLGVARRLDLGTVHKPDQLKTAYHNLISNKKYIDAVTGPTADKSLVDTRIDLATEAFANVK